MLGTPDADKRHVVFDTPHDVRLRRADLIKEVSPGTTSISDGSIDRNERSLEQFLGLAFRTPSKLKLDDERSAFCCARSNFRHIL